MFLYHLTLQPPTAIQVAVSGNFSGLPKAQELLFCRGTSVLELLRLNQDTGKLESIIKSNLFCTIRSLTPFRLPEDDRDHIAIGSDSGAIVILKYGSDEQADSKGEKGKKGQFHRVQMQTFGRTGVRRAVPGQFITSDPHGRTIMIASMDKQKFAYILSRELETGKMIMSSPLEAHKSNIICTAFVSLDSGHDNPIYAAIESEYNPKIDDGEKKMEKTAIIPSSSSLHQISINDNGQGRNVDSASSSSLSPSPSLPSKEIMIYEVDLGLNHVVRRWSDPIEPSSNILIPVVGGDEGPGGVLIGSENTITYLKPLQINTEACKISISIPKRKATLANTLITSGTLVKARTGYFYLLQSELGDLFKLTLKTDDNDNDDNDDHPSSDGNKNNVASSRKKRVTSLSIRYFDTVPPCSNISVLRSGFLFIPSEYADNYLYQFHSLGDHDDEVEWTISLGSNDASSSLPLDKDNDDIDNENDNDDHYNSNNEDVDKRQNKNSNNKTKKKEWIFTPRKLRNLALVDQIENYSEMTDGTVMNLMPNTEISPQIFVTQGRGNQYSSFNVIRQGMGIEEEIASISINPSSFGIVNANYANNDCIIGIWRMNDSISLISTINSTNVLVMEGGQISIMNDDDNHQQSRVSSSSYGFIKNAPTINGGMLDDGSLVQIMPTRLVQVRDGRIVFEWKSIINIACSCINNRQVALYLDENRSIVYLELDGSHQLLLRETKSIVGLPERVQSMALSPVLRGEKRGRFLALGCMDNVVRILGLNPGECLEPQSLQPLASRPLSMTMVRMSDHMVDSNHPTLYLFLGLENGVLLWIKVDHLNGTMEDAITRYLGPKPINFISKYDSDQSKFHHNEECKPVIVACSDMKSWILYVSKFTNSISITPINYDHGIRRAIPIIATGSFEEEEKQQQQEQEEQEEETKGKGSESISVLALTMNNQVKLLQMEDPNVHFHRHRIPLPRTPKKIIFSHELGIFGFVCSENYSFDQREEEAIRRIYNHGITKDNKDNENDEMDKLKIEIRAPKNRWTSELIFYDPFKGEFPQIIKMNHDEVILCASFIKFHNTDEEEGEGEEREKRSFPPAHSCYLAIGVSVGFSQFPQRKSLSNSIHLYRIQKRSGHQDDSENQSLSLSLSSSLSIELVHKTAIEGIPTCMSSFGGRLLVGIDRIMRMYDCGKARLLRKCEVKLPTTITCLQSQGWRIVAGDSWEGVHFIYYRAKENQFLIFCDDTIPRRMTHSMIMLDFNTVAGSDKLGNFFIVRVPSSISEEAESDTLAINQAGRQEYLFGAGAKVEHVADFYLGDVITMMQKVSLVPGQRPVILYVTILGAIGVFIPFTSRTSALSMQNLETIMRTEVTATLAARNHLSYRSSFQPTRSVIDGDLIETFLKFDIDRQETIARGLEQNLRDIIKEIREIRSTCGFY